MAAVARCPLIAAAIAAALPPLAAASARAGGEALAAVVAGASRDDDAGVLLQRGASGLRAIGRSESQPDGNYWPHARGRVGHYGQTPYGKAPENLTKSLAWSWDAPSYNTLLWCTLIDSKKNVYVVGMLGIWKFTPEGKHVWYNPMSSEAPSLVGDRIIGMRMFDCLFFALSQETGELLYQKKIWSDNGSHGDFVEAHNGVAVVAVGLQGEMGDGGAPSSRVAGVSVEDGSLLWDYPIEAGLWNILALFPDDESTIFSDVRGGVYRIGLHDGRLIWHTPGPENSYGDGGSTLGPDGSTYTCAQPAGMGGWAGQTGLLRKFRLSDGAMVWEAPLPYPCVNFPAVSPDGRSVVVAPGGLAGPAQTKLAAQMPVPERKDFYHKQIDLGNKQRAYYNMTDLDGAIMALDTETGAVQWRHDVYPYGGVAFAGDEKRAWRSLNHPLRNMVPHCWPSHWSGATINEDGTVWIGRSSGDFYVYDPKKDQEQIFRFDDGILMGGAAFAPGLMVFATCSSVYAFHLPEV